LVLSKKFTKGYVQLVYEAMVKRSQGSTSVHRSEGLSEEDFRTKVLQNMGSIKNMTELFVKAVYAEQQAGLGEAIGFFDVQFSPIPRAADVEPLAKLYGGTGQELVSEMEVVRPTCQQLVKSGVCLPERYWKETLEHWGSRVPLLRNCVALMLCLIESTGVLEQNLAVFRNFAKHGFSNSNLGNCCKLRFDSSPVGQYIGQEYRVTPFGARCWRVTPRSMEGS